MTLGEKIASARKEKGMTQEMLAEQLGVTRQAVARWETGKALPGTANLFMPHLARRIGTYSNPTK